MILVSACLAGLPVRYNGKARPNGKIMKMVADGKALPVCPEQLGGLPIPRPPQEIRGGDGAAVLGRKAKVFNCNGENVTKQFIKGANETLKMVQTLGVREVIFASRSPSCGCGKIYDGSFTGKLREGDGVTTALLKRNGIKVVTEEGL